MEHGPALVDLILISNFVHQIINPLNGVLGTIDNLIDGTISDMHKRQQRLVALRGQLAHSIEMIRNLAFLSQLQTSEGIESFRRTALPLNVPSTLIEAIQFFQELGEQKDVKIELMDSQTQYYIVGHKNLLKQVVLNILDNALKYSDSGSKVQIFPRVQKKTGQLIIEVVSVGIGFEYEETDKLFDLGGRGRSAEEVKASGSGIGLYICKRIMELAHDGIIEAEHSNSTRRTIFRLRFPSYSIKKGKEYE